MAEAWLCVVATYHHRHRRRRQQQAALWWCAAVVSETEELMAARAGLLRYALPMLAATPAAAAVYRLRAAWTLVRAGRLAMYRCRAARHRAVAVAVSRWAALLPTALVLALVLVAAACRSRAEQPAQAQHHRHAVVH